MTYFNAAIININDKRKLVRQLKFHERQCKQVTIQFQVGTVCHPASILRRCTPKDEYPESVGAYCNTPLLLFLKKDEDADNTVNQKTALNLSHVP